MYYDIKTVIAVILLLGVASIKSDHIEEDCREIQCQQSKPECPSDSELKNSDEDNIFDKVPSVLIPFEMFSAFPSQPKHELNKRSLKFHKVSKRESVNSHLETETKRCCPEFQCVCKECAGVPKCKLDEMVVLEHQGYGLPGNCCSTYKCVPLIECSADSSPNVSYYKDECTKCDCYGGQELCQKLCEIKKDDSASNCYSEYLSRPMLNGDSWLEDEDCTECKCDDGESRCQESVCGTVDCPNPIKIAGQCCKVCPPTPTTTDAPSTAKPTVLPSTETPSVKSSPTTETSIPTSTSDDKMADEDALSERHHDDIETTFSTPAVISSLGLFEKYRNIIIASGLAVIIVAVIGGISFMLLKKQKKKKSVYSTIPCFESNQSSSVALA